MSFKLPPHIVQKYSNWYVDTEKGKFVHSDWIKWYCDEYWKSVDINPDTMKPIKRHGKRMKKVGDKYVPRLDWDAYDNIEVVKEEYKDET